MSWMNLILVSFKNCSQPIAVRPNCIASLDEDKTVSAFLMTSFNAGAALTFS